MNLYASKIPIIFLERMNDKMANFQETVKNVWGKVVDFCKKCWTAVANFFKTVWGKLVALFTKK